MMSNRAFLVVTVFVILAFVGLFFVSTRPSEGSKDVGGSGGAAEVKIVTLEDGTKCAVLIGFYKGAISCDWRN